MSITIMKLTQIYSILLTLIAGMLLIACSSPTTEQGSRLEFSFAQFDVLNKVHSRFTRQTIGDTSNITSVKILVNELEEGEKKEIASATLSEELESVSIKIPANKNLNIRGEAFAGETLLYIGDMNLVALLPGETTPVNLVMYPADENAEPIQVDIGVANKVGNGPSYGATFSYSRDYVLFTSDADNLVEDDTNQKRDLFLKNVKTGIITNIHIDENGKPVATSDDTGPTGADISADGRYIVFASNADGIVATDKNGLSDIFLRDTVLNTVKLISKKSNGTLSDKDSYNPSISDDGRYIAFSSDAALVGQKPGVFLYDRILSQLTFLLANAVNPKFSGNGGFLVYVDSTDGALYRYNTSNKTKLRITSVETASQKLGKIQQISTQDAATKLGARDHITLNEFEYVINESGRFIVFVPYTDTDELKSHHVYLYDDNDKSITLVSAEANGDPLPLNDKQARLLSISQDGRYIVFLFNSTVYVKSTVDKQLSPVIHGDYPFISPDGREIGYSDTVTGHLYFLPNPIFSVLAGSESNNQIPTNLAYKISGNDVIITWNAITGASFYRTYVGSTSDLTSIASTTNSDTTKTELILSFNDITTTQFYVAVSSVNSRGESALSAVLKLPTGDLTPPTVLENTISPASDSVDIDTNNVISLSFSEAMAAGSINNLSIRLNNGHIDLPTTVELTGKDVTLTPKVPLAPFQEYEVTVSNDVADLAGNILGADYIWKFTTGFEINKVDSGNNHSCGIREDSTLWCWGRNQYGQLGDGTLETKVGPIQVNVNSEYGLIDSWKSVAVGGAHTCAIKTDGSLWCWGYNGWGLIGNNSSSSTNIPIQISPDTQWEQVAAGGNHTCAIDSDTTMWCWGAGYAGQTGLGSTTTTFIPTQVGIETSYVGNWIDISAGEDSTCGLRKGGAEGEKLLYCWGKNDNPSQFDTSINYGNVPTLFSDESDWQTLSVGTRHACSSKQNGTVFCWGKNASGELGISTLTPSSPLPIQENTLSTDWASIAASRSSHTCAVKYDGTMFCWGSNDKGQLADEDLISRFEAKQEFSLADDWAMVSGGINTTCGVKGDNTLLCWGDNNNGQTGAGRNILTVTPTQVQPEHSDWSMVSAAMGHGYRYEGETDYHSCGLRDNGTLYCWGANWDGQLGIGNTSTQLIPIRAQTSTKFNFLATGDSHSCAISNADELWCWGDLNYGQLGLGGIDASYVDTPQKLTIDNNFWSEISTGYFHTCGIKTDSTLWCWGYDNDGQLGQGPSSDYINLYTPTPVYIPTPPPISVTIPAINNSWSQISAGGYHTCAINSDESLWCWGRAWDGQLGNGNRFIEISPVILPVLSTEKWIQVATGDEHTCGIQSDKSLWCWGTNDYFIGIENDTNYNFEEPQQVDDSSWETVDASMATTCAIKTNGSLWCWGYGEGGKLGTGDQNSQTIPTQEITGSLDWKDVSVGPFHTCASKNNGSIWCWGWNDEGSVGTNHFFYAPQPVNFNAIGEQQIFFEYSGGKEITPP